MCNQIILLVGNAKGDKKEAIVEADRHHSIFHRSKLVLYTRTTLRSSNDT